MKLQSQGSEQELPMSSMRVRLRKWSLVEAVLAPRITVPDGHQTTTQRAVTAVGQGNIVATGGKINRRPACSVGRIPRRFKRCEVRRAGGVRATAIHGDVENVVPKYRVGPRGITGRTIVKGCDWIIGLSKDPCAGNQADYEKSFQWVNLSGGQRGPREPSEPLSRNL